MSYYPEHAAEFTRLIESLKGRKVVVIGHMRPDGDCIGSQVALARVLQSQGVEAVCVNHDTVPRALQTFVGGTPFLLDTEFDGTAEDYVAVTVDCADHGRIGPGLAEKFPQVHANVDHHVSNDRYAAHNFIHPESSATAEILAGLFIDNDYPVDAVTAQALYVGIATDTGQFRFQTTTKQVFNICCTLAEAGADPAAAAMELYERESRGKLDLLQRFLASFEYLCDGRVCIGYLHSGVYDETGASKEESEGLVDYARSIDGVEIGILVEERNGSIKGSFRAKDAVHKVHELAREFNGGGHACAAGFNLTETSIEDFVPALRKRLEQHFASLATT